MAEGEFIFEDSATIEATFVMDVTEADHNALFNRDIPDQHPISAITDLQTTLDGISGDISAETTRAEGVEGSLSNLTTENKTNLVSAINEVDSHADTNTNNLANEVTRAKSVEGVLSNLTTTNKTNLVEAINEVDSNSDTNATNLSNHISDKNNPHEVTKAQVGLGNVDNTADLDKPLSTATQTALDGKQNNLSQAQLNAVNSGITQALVTQIGTNQNDITTINGKIPSDASSSNQLADKSYVDTADGGLQTQITANAGDINTIDGKIPSAASSSNQLADKNFVNSSISTNTATFIGTFNSVEELEAYSGTLTNNDYAFVIVTDSLGNTAYDRYKYTTATTPASWLFEYELNNSSFTADQWAAINSGANTTNIGQIATNTSAISGLSTSKQDKIDSSNKLDSDLVDDSGQTNKFVTASEKAQITTNANNIIALQSGKADKSTTLAGYGITNAYTKTEVDTALNNKADKSTTYTKTEVDTIANGKANVGLDNLNADGQMIVDSVDGKISNCILEIPQNIKLEISGSNVIVKAGSIGVRPGSTYQTYTFASDYSYDYSTASDGTYVFMIRVYSGGPANIGLATNKTVSGATDSLAGTAYHTWFDTANLQIKRYSSDPNTPDTASLYPFAIVNVENGVPSFAKDSNGNDMIFNGAGFIGHHAFVYPNVKWLQSLGYNSKNCLKSAFKVTNGLYIVELLAQRNSISAYNASIFAQRYYAGEFDNFEDLPDTANTQVQSISYIKNGNYMCYAPDSKIWGKAIGNYTNIIDYTYDGTTVTDFTIRQPVRLATTEMLDKVQDQVDTNTSDIATKADVDLSNITDSGKLVIGTEIGNRTRKDISSLVANGTLSQAVAEQNLEKYGIHIGDYFTGTSGYTYTVADMDTFYGGYNVCLVVDTKHNEPWNYSTTITANNVTFTYDSAGEGYYAWKNGEDYVYTSMRQPNPNSDKAYSDTTLTTEYATITAVNNFTDGGYVASNLHSYLTGTALTNVQSDLGNNHLVAHNKIYTNAMTSNRYNRFGQNNGASSNWAWSTGQYISALTEAQVYGTIIWSSSGFDTGEAFKQLDVFRKFRANQIFGNTGIWLRDVVSSSHSALLDIGGSAGAYNTRSSARVVGLIMFH